MWLNDYVQASGSDIAIRVRERHLLRSHHFGNTDSSASGYSYAAVHQCCSAISTAPICFSQLVSASLIAFRRGIKLTNKLETSSEFFSQRINAIVLNALNHANILPTPVLKVSLSPHSCLAHTQDLSDAKGP